MTERASPELEATAGAPPRRTDGGTAVPRSAGDDVNDRGALRRANMSERKFVKCAGRIHDVFRATGAATSRESLGLQNQKCSIVARKFLVTTSIRTETARLVRFRTTRSTDWPREPNNCPETSDVLPAEEFLRLCLTGFLLLSGSARPPDTPGTATGRSGGVTKKWKRDAQKGANKTVTRLALVPKLAAPLSKHSSSAR
jgi:hypothetical protein